MIVRELIVRLGFNVDNGALDNVDRRLDRVKGEAERAANAFAAIGAAISGFAAAQGIADVADKMQSLQARIGLLPQTIGDVNAAFDEVANHADTARQGVEAYASFYIKAGNATKDFIKNQADLLKIADGAAFGLAAEGATADEQGQAFFQLGQAIGSPIVQMEEMNTLIDVAPGLFRALGQAIPGANGNLKAFIGTGKVTGRMLAEGLMKVLPQFERQMLQIPLTFGQSTQIVSNHWDRMIHRLNRESSAITMIAGFIVDAIDKIDVAINGLIEVVGGSDNAVRLLIATLAALGLMAGVALAPMIAAGLEFAAIAGMIALALEDVFTWLNGGESLIDAMIGPWEEWRGSVMGTFNAIANVAMSIIRIFEALWNPDADALIGAVGDFLTAMRSLGDALAPIMLGLVKLLWDGFTALLSHLAGALITAFVAAIKVLIEGGISAAGQIGSAILASIQSAGSGLLSTLTGGLLGGGPKVAPAQVTGAGVGKSPVNQTNNTNVTVQVPAGTNAEQKAHIERSAKAAFSAAHPYNPRDIAAHGK